MRTETRYVYIAYDDTVFKTEAECREYEDKAFSQHFILKFTSRLDDDRWYDGDVGFNCLTSGDKIAQFIECHKDLVSDYIKFLNNQEEK